jgi:hypothetical protein
LYVLVIYTDSHSSHNMSESVFDLSESLESINGGCARYDMSQMYPISGAINNSVVGAGQASGLTTFQWQDNTWWSPCQSYFILTCTFSNYGTPSTSADCAYADNFAMTLFSQINTQINSRPLDTVNTPWLIDTALTYSNAHNNFLKTWGSLTRVGEPLSTRIRNTQRNGGVVQIVFRPPVSIFDVKLLPPGAQYKIDFNWANNGLNAFETINGSVTWGQTLNTDVSISISEFSFYKATVTPDASVPLPQRGVIDLSPCQSLQYFLNSGSVLKQNITLPSTTNRILIGFQDTNASSTVSTTPPVDYICGIGNGYNPATSFSNIFTNVTSANPTFLNTVGLQNLWLDLPELGIQEPKPIYNFSNGLLDYMRAYSDFCHVTQGTKNNEEGSIPFGSMSTIVGTTIIQPLVATNTTGTLTAVGQGTLQIGDLNNPQQYTYMPISVGPVGSTTTTTAADGSTYNQTARWGWLGRCPGPIFAFPVVRPPGKQVTTGTLNVTLAGNCTSLSATIMASYSMALVVEHRGDGYYNFDIIQGV